MNTTVQIKPKY